MKNRLVNIGVALLGTIIALLILEFGINYFIINIANEKFYYRYASWDQLTTSNRFVESQLHEPHRYLAYIPTKNFSNETNLHNSLGFRGEEIVLPKPDGEYRIVCLGGSTTYSSGVNDYRDSYPFLLQKYLNENGFEHVTVVNGGTAAYTSLDSLINLQTRVLDLNPDLVIVYHSVNDIFNRLVWPPEEYVGDFSGARLPLASEFIDFSFWESITIARMIMIELEISIPPSHLSYLFNRHPSSYFGGAFIKQGVDGKYPSGIFEEVGADEMFSANSPVYFERNMRNIVSVAETWGLEVMLASFAYGPNFPNEPKVYSEEFRYAYTEMTEVIEDIANTMNVSYLDFASEFPTDSVYFTDGTHLTAEGNRLKAEIFGEYLIESKLIK